ncbi:MAG: DUF3530 family protein [Gammaproteobacteria bacterium]|nr:DUF3530 family protein [Gammaproteobacteria bacterium]
MSLARWVLCALLVSGPLFAAEPAKESAPAKPVAETPAASVPVSPIDRPRPVALRRAGLRELAARAGADARWLEGPGGRYLCLCPAPRRNPVFGNILMVGEAGQAPGEPPWQTPLAEALRDLGWQVWILAAESVPEEAAADGEAAEPDAEAELRHGLDAALAALKDAAPPGAVFLVAPGASATALLAKPDTLPPVIGLAGLDASLAAPIDGLARRRLAVLDIARAASRVQLAERRAEARRAGLAYRGLHLVGADRHYSGMAGFLARQVHAWALPLAVQARAEAK